MNSGRHDSLPDTIAELDDVNSKSNATKVLLQSKALKVTDLPASLWSLSSVTVLDLSRNSLVSLPGAIAQLTSVTSLKLSHNRIELVPAEISKLIQLIDLDLGCNQLTAVHSSIGSLSHLKYLNLMSNALTNLPQELGYLSKLYRLGLKGNQLTTLPESLAGLHSLVELFITDNQLVSLPDGLSGLTSLVKLQASFNQLKTLPAAIGQLQKLELMRVAVNNIQQVPTEFDKMKALAWFSLAGNPACKPSPPIRLDILPVSLNDIQMDAALGDGASGDVFAARMNGKDVAVKVFKAESSPDGHARDEIAVTCSVDHPNLIKVIGIIDHPHALVMERVWGKPLALKPNFESLLRCRWLPGQTFTLQFVLNVARSVASALAYLHEHSICHGDVYAHNVLAESSGHSILCDYGASFFYMPNTVSYETQEVRAYGLLLHDLVTRIDGVSIFDRSAKDPLQQMQEVVQLCIDSSTPAQRPSFSEIHSKLLSITSS